MQRWNEDTAKLLTAMDNIADLLDKSGTTHTSAGDRPSDPWTFTADTPEIEAQLDAALARFAPQPERFVGQFARFHDALLGGGELPVTLADARAALEIITAIYASARTGQAVDLPIGMDHPYYAGWLPGGATVQKI